MRSAVRFARWCRTPVHTISSNVISQLADTIDRQLMDLEIGQSASRLRSSVCRTLVALKSIPTTRAAGQRARGVLRRLRCSAAGDEDRALFRVRLVRPEQVEVRAAPVRVLPAPSIVVEIVDRPRIRIPFVEVLDCRRHVMAGSRFWLPAVGVRCQAARLRYLPLVLAAVSFSST